MKQYTLTLITNEPRIIDRVEGDSLIEVLSQLNIILIKVIRQEELMKKIRSENDGIPF